MADGFLFLSTGGHRIAEDGTHQVEMTNEDNGEIEWQDSPSVEVCNMMLRRHGKSCPAS